MHIVLTAFIFRGRVTSYGMTVISLYFQTNKFLCDISFCLINIYQCLPFGIIQIFDNIILIISHTCNKINTSVIHSHRRELTHIEHVYKRSLFLSLYDLSMDDILRVNSSFFDYNSMSPHSVYIL